MLPWETTLNIVINYSNASESLMTSQIRVVAFGFHHCRGIYAGVRKMVRTWGGGVTITAYCYNVSLEQNQTPEADTW